MALRSALFVVVASVVSVVGIAGCDSPGLSSKSKTPNQVAATSKDAAQNANPNGAANAGQTGPQTPAVFTPGLSVSDAIALACGIKPREKQKVQPSFEFDSAALAEADRQMLSEVAKCLTEGNLKGKSVALIGRADARGEPEYNMTLGGSRADAVQRYMIDLGVSKARTNATSRGAIDATGKDEAGFAEDRRVDIELSQ